MIKLPENYKLVYSIEEKSKKLAIIKSTDNKVLFLKYALNQDIDLIKSLKNEVECLLILSDSGVVPKLYNYEISNNKSYIMMEYIYGKRLCDINLKKLSDKIICMMKILDCMEEIHKRGIIHCDLKPENILIDSRNNIKIVDFGISSINGKQNLRNYGSINYCSPEQILKKELSFETDIYSLGIIFYELVTSKKLFNRSMEDIKCKIISSEFDSTNNLQIDKIIFRSLNINIDLRYNSVTEFKQDLNKLLKIIKKNEENEGGIKMNKEKYLPLGSVVLLKEAKKRVMVIGFMVSANETSDKVFDYMGCLYPEGVLSSEQSLVFNHDQIDKIFYLGYSDNEEKEFKDKLNKLENSDITKVKEIENN